MKIKIKNPILGVPITIIDKIADDGFNETVLNMFDLLSSAKSILKSSTDIKNKQLLLHFIFEKTRYYFLINGWFIYHKFNHRFYTSSINNRAYNVNCIRIYELVRLYNIQQLQNNK